jgi:MurNAc alpha-1-phosphate uridylyltransferase
MAGSPMLPVAILAGGLAKRMRPVTETMPKSLIPVAGKPFIFHQLRLLKREGVERVVLCVGHLGEMIRDQVGDGTRFGVEIAYSFDGAALLGTGGALLRALGLLGEASFVLYGDSYLDIAYRPVLDAFRHSGKPALMTVFRNEGRWDTSNVLFDGSAIRRYDKKAPSPEMRHIDYGLGIVSRAAFAGWTAGTAFDLAEVYGALVVSGNLAGYEITRRFYEIGTPQGLADAAAFLAGKSS